MKTIRTVFAGILTLAAAAASRGQAPQDTAAVRAVESGPYFYAAVEMTGSYAQHEFAFQTLFIQAGTQNLCQAAPFGVYYNDPQTVLEAELRWDLGMALADSMPVQAPLKLKKWPYPTVAVLPYEGPFDGPEIGQAYAKLFGWVGANGYAPAGPIQETFYGIPSVNEKGQWGGKVKLAVPVEKAK
jgi:DNA gyrase inhibitor GyrI